jgi:hypothetical protein
MEPDAVAVSTRFDAEHTIIGNIEQACRALAARIRVLSVVVEEKRTKQGVVPSLHHQLSKTLDHFSYMAHHSPDTVEVELPDGDKLLTRPVMEDLGVKGLLDNSKILWDAFHAGEVRRV